MKKVIFKISIAFMVFWLLSFLLRSIDLVEFSEIKYRNTFDQILSLGLPISVLLTLTGTLGRRNGPGRFIATIMLTITAAIGMFIIHLIMYLSVDWCFANFSTTLYTHKTDDNIQIMTRSYSCDAWEADFVFYEGQYKVHWYGPFFITTEPIDTASINKSEWIPEGSLRK